MLSRTLGSSPGLETVIVYASIFFFIKEAQLTYLFSFLFVLPRWAEDRPIRPHLRLVCVYFQNHHGSRPTPFSNKSCYFLLDGGFNVTNVSPLTHCRLQEGRISRLDRGAQSLAYTRNIWGPFQ